MTFNRDLFNLDLDYAGGIDTVSIKADMKRNTLRGWSDGSRTPRFISLAGIAAVLGYLPDRYFLDK